MYISKSKIIRVSGSGGGAASPCEGSCCSVATVAFLGPNNVLCMRFKFSAGDITGLVSRVPLCNDDSVKLLDRTFHGMSNSGGESLVKVGLRDVVVR
jgi:hypothetical protein